MSSDHGDLNLIANQDKADIDGRTPKDKLKKTRGNKDFNFVNSKKNKKALNVNYQTSKLLNQQKIKAVKQQAKANAQRIQRGNTTYSVQSAVRQQAQSNQRSGSIGILGGRAEQLEIEFCSLDEVPFLNSLENVRMRLASPNNRYLINVEKEVTDSFPD